MAEINYRIRNSFWKEAVANYYTLNEKSVSVKKHDLYVVEAADFIQAQTHLTDELESANIDPIIDPIQTPRYGEIIFNDEMEDVFFKVKVQITDFDGVKTKRQTHEYLVQAESDMGARNAIRDYVYKDSMEDWEIIQITKTKILGVLEHGKHIDTLTKENV